MSNFTFKFQEETNSFKVFAANNEDHIKIRDLLLQYQPQNLCFVEAHASKGLRARFLELDHRALEILRNKGQGINITLETSQQYPFELKQKAANEQTFANKLEEEKYELGYRIWSKKDNTRTDVFYSKIGSNIYSSKNLDGLIETIKGEKYLVESNKPIIDLSLNPLESFRIFRVALGRTLNPNKQVFHLNEDWSRKKQVKPLIENSTRIPFVVDGADDAANAMNNTGLPLKTVSAMQGLLIFPIFLQGVYLGFDGLGGEALDTRESSQKYDFRNTKLKAISKNFRNKLCELCNFDPQNFNDDNPQALVRAVVSALQPGQVARTQGKEKEIEKLIEDYQKNLQTEIENPTTLKLLSAYTGAGAMTLMMTSVAVYEAQALINMFGPIKNITTAEDVPLSMLSNVSNIFGFSGQILMTLFASYKMSEELCDWNEVTKTLKEFRENSANVSELAQKITTNILESKRFKHATQFVGNASLASGQALMALCGPMGLALNPAFYAGLAATGAGILTTSASELRYQMLHALNEDLSPLEQKIITSLPQISHNDNIDEVLLKHAQKRIFALEILGHLHAPQLILYRKFLEQYKDDGVIGKASRNLSLAYKYLGMKLSHPYLDRLNQNLPNIPNAPNPVTAFSNFIDRNKDKKTLAGSFAAYFYDDYKRSPDLVLNSERIKLQTTNPYNLDLFSVDDEWLDKIWEKAEELQTNHKENNINREEKHKEIISRLLDKFITTKLVAQTTTPSSPEENTKNVCQKIIENGGAGAEYLQQKLLRAIANKELDLVATHRSQLLPDIKKQKTGIVPTILKTFGVEGKAKSVKLSHLELDQIDPESLHNFLTKPRPQNYFILNSLFGSEKKPALAKAHQEQFFEVKSDNRRPFTNITTVAQNLAQLKEVLKEPVPTTQEPAPQEFEIITTLVPSKSQQSLLENLKRLSEEKIKSSPDARQSQIDSQNHTIDKIVKKRRKFILADQFFDPNANKTIFTYIHPDHENLAPDHPTRLAKQVTIIRDDITKKVEVLHGDESKALLVGRPTIERNGFAVKIGKNRNQEFFGNHHHSPISSIKENNFSLPPSPTTASNAVHQLSSLLGPANTLG